MHIIELLCGLVLSVTIDLSTDQVIRPSVRSIVYVVRWLHHDLSAFIAPGSCHGAARSLAPTHSDAVNPAIPVM